MTGARFIDTARRRNLSPSGRRPVVLGSRARRRAMGQRRRQQPTCWTNAHAAKQPASLYTQQSTSRAARRRAAQRDYLLRLAGRA